MLYALSVPPPLFMTFAAPYSGLSKNFAGTWLAGYGYDTRTGIVRVYLSTEQPMLPKPSGKQWCETAVAWLAAA